MGQERPPIVFYAFDLLRLNGKNFQNLPIEERKAKLEELLILINLNGNLALEKGLAFSAIEDSPTFKFSPV